MLYGWRSGSSATARRRVSAEEPGGKVPRAGAMAGLGGSGYRPLELGLLSKYTPSLGEIPIHHRS